MAKNPHLKDMTALRFGALVVLEQQGNAKGGGARWLCKCDCGNDDVVLGSNLRTGLVRSCGCLGSRKTIGARTRSHGKTRTRLWIKWQSIHQRCANKNDYTYGGRGITVCDEWRSFESFEAWAKSNGYVDGLTIERLDNDRGYSPDNCTWIPLGQQAVNRSIVPRAPDGRPWFQIARDNNITTSAYRTRVFAGWPYEKAATQPMRYRKFA